VALPLHRCHEKGVPYEVLSVRPRELPLRQRRPVPLFQRLRLREAKGLSSPRPLRGASSE